MAYGESEIKEGKNDLARRERIRAKSGTVNTSNYCSKCKQQFKNAHGLSIHNAQKHGNAKINELETELANLKNDKIHPIVNQVMNGNILQEILDLSESLDLSKQQMINLIKYKKEKP